jgi:hypothetical protein
MRNAAIIGIFTVLTYIRSKGLGGSVPDWETVQSIGFTGLLLIPFMFSFIRRNTWIRLALGVVVLVLFQTFRAQISILDGYQGGIGACVGYLGIVLLASVMGDLAEKGFLYYAVGTAAAVGAMLLVKSVWGEALFYPIFNASYMVVSFFVLNTAYFIAYILDKLFIKNRPIPVLETLGKNIFLYLLLSLLLCGTVYLFTQNKPLDQIGLLIAEIICVAFYALLTIPLKKKNIMFRL